MEADAGHRIPHAVSAADLEPFDFIHPVDSVRAVCYPDIDLVRLALEQLHGLGRFVRHLFEAVIPVQGDIGQPVADRFLAAGMDVVRLVRSDQVVGADNRRIGNGLRGIVLRLAEPGAAVPVVTGIEIRGDFHHVEGHGCIRIPPVLPPLVHKVRHTGHELVFLPHIGASLIPDETTGRIALERHFHGIVHLERPGVSDQLGNSFRAEVFRTIRCDGLPGEPALDTGPSPRESDDSDGNV